ncbi:hypothetical protein ACU4GG_08380 [Streptomyces nojiriensis]
MAADQPNRSSEKETTQDQPDTSVSQEIPRQGRGTKSLGSAAPLRRHSGMKAAPPSSSRAKAAPPTHKEGIEKPPEGKATVPKQFPGREAGPSGPSGRSGRSGPSGSTGRSGTANTAPKMSEAGSKTPVRADTAGKTAGATNAGPANTGAPNAGAPNAGTPNAGTPNAGATNAGATNAGATNASPANAGATNAGAANVGATNAGAANAGAANAGATNTGAANAGAANAGATINQGMNGVAGNLAGGATQKAIEGDGSSATRRHAGRYAGAAVSGAVSGAQAGGLPGAAVGAAKNLAVEGAQDTVKGVSKATGGSPDAKPADQRELGAGGTGYERGATKDDEGLGSKAAKGVAVGGGASAAPPAMAVVMAMALLNWLKSMFFAAMAMAVNAGKLLWMLIVNILKAVGHAIAAPFVAIGSFLAKGPARSWASPSLRRLPLWRQRCRVRSR